MMRSSLPCLKDEHNMAACGDCAIANQGLCDVFKVFARKYLSYCADEFEEETAERTVETIFKQVENIKESEYIEGAFYRFCEKIYETKRIDVLRSKRNWFQKNAVKLETDMRADIDASVEAVHEEGLSYSEKGLLREVTRVLEELKTEEDNRCADLILDWYKLNQNGYNNKEIAELRRVSYSKYRKDLSRCFQEMRSVDSVFQKRLGA